MSSIHYKCALCTAEVAERQPSGSQPHLTGSIDCPSPERNWALRSAHVKLLFWKESRRGTWTNDDLNSFSNTTSNQEASTKMKRKWHQITNISTEICVFYSKSRRPRGHSKGMNHSEALCGVCGNVWLDNPHNIQPNKVTHVTSDKVPPKCIPYLSQGLWGFTS